MADSGTEPLEHEAQHQHFNAEVTYELCATLQDLSQLEVENDLAHWLVPTPLQEHTVALGGWIPSGEIISDSKKKKSPTATGPRPGPEDKTNYVSSNIRGSRGHATMANAMESGYFGGSLWKGCVEPRTFRYIPNNGQYRRSKAIVQRVTNHRPQKHIREKVLTSEQKHLQREIQQEMRHEFEMMQTQGHWAKAEADKYRESRDKSAGVGYAWKFAPGSDKGQLNQRSSNHKPVDMVRSAPADVEKSAPPKPPRRSFSPVHLPAIAVPLVNTSLVKSRLSESFNSKVNLINYSEENTKKRPSLSEPIVPQRTQRSFSEPPPPPAPKCVEPKIIDSFELSPLGFDPEHVSAQDMNRLSQTRSTTVPHQRRVSRLSDPTISTKDSHPRPWNKHGLNKFDHPTGETVLADVILNSQGVSEKSSLPIESPHKKKVKTPRKNSEGFSETSQAPISTSQLRYMSASGEVTVVPQFGQDSRRSSAGNFYSMLERENQKQSAEEPFSDVRSNKENLHSVMTTNKFSVSPPPKPHADAGIRKVKSHIIRSVVIPMASSTSTQHAGNGSFRAHPIGRLKSREKKLDTLVPPTSDFLPEIAGRKCDMASTSHRIV